MQQVVDGQLEDTAAAAVGAAARAAIRRRAARRLGALVVAALGMVAFTALVLIGLKPPANIFLLLCVGVLAVPAWFSRLATVLAAQHFQAEYLRLVAQGMDVHRAENVARERTLRRYRRW